MEKETFQTYLRTSIPIIKAMDVQVAAFDSQNVILKASLEPNINHLHTAFGGSINTLLMMAAWSWMYHSLITHQESGTIVIQNSRSDFIFPISGLLKATALPASEEELRKFYRMFRKFGKGRIRLASEICDQEQVAARFEGNFVVFKKD